MQEKGPKGTTTYEYSPLNQQTKVITHQGNIQVNRYDAEGLRAEIEENERLTKFIFHKENILVETDKEDNAIARLIRGHEVVASDRTVIMVSCLHFGQNRGKFSSIVSSRIFNRVLF